MPAEILIVGQGLAGTLLAWAFERAGFSFEMVDAGGLSASQVAAGIINPITGRRFVRSAHVDTWLPLARRTYAEFEAELGASLWREMRIHRLFRDDLERERFATKLAGEEKARADRTPLSEQGEALAPYVGNHDDAGFWIEGAAQVDVPRLLELARGRWEKAGRFHARRVMLADALRAHALVIDCTGAAQVGVEQGASRWEFVPWEFSKGEILELAIDGLAADVIVNRGEWLLPMGVGRAWVGATHEPGRRDAVTTAEARDRLAAAARGLTAEPFTVTRQFAGIRVNLLDRRPVIGRHRDEPRLGLCNGLGAKGALSAPALAEQWAAHIARGAPFAAEFAVTRFL